jgi:hypothetical protein
MYLIGHRTLRGRGKRMLTWAPFVLPHSDPSIPEIQLLDHARLAGILQAIGLIRDHCAAVCLALRAPTPKKRKTPANRQRELTYIVMSVAVSISKIISGATYCSSGGATRARASAARTALHHNVSDCSYRSTSISRATYRSSDGATPALRAHPPPAESASHGEKNLYAGRKG